MPAGAIAEEKKRKNIKSKFEFEMNERKLVHMRVLVLDDEKKKYCAPYASAYS